MIRAIIAALLLIVAAPSLAQEWGPYGEQPVTYPELDSAGDITAVISGALPVRGDGTTEWGGTPPAMALQPSAIQNPVNYNDGLDLAGGVTGTDENKLRLTCYGDRVVIRTMDPIKFKGQRRAGHPHMFWGALTVNENSDYTQLRNDATAILPSCPGNGLWGTSYWMPTVIAPNALGDGIPRIPMFKFDTIYYVCPWDTSAPRECVKFPRGLQWIGGMDVDNPNETNITTELAAANALNSAGTYIRQGNTAVRPSWRCYNSAGVPQGAGAPWIRDPDGNDAMNGGAGCPEGGFLRLEIAMQDCWDGKNLTSPNGRDHVRYSIKIAQDQNRSFCPTGWYRIPQIEHKFDYYYHYVGGQPTYRTWYCSSDPTTEAATGIQVGACETVHMDVIVAMDPRAQDDWEANCTGSQDSADWAGACNGNTISVSPDRSLRSSDITPSASIAWDGSDASGYHLIPSEASNKRIRFRKGM